MTDSRLPFPSPVKRPQDELSAVEKLGAVLLAATAAFIWVRPLTSSLWLDETVTFWVIRDGPRHILERSLHFQASPLYFWFPWISSRLAGASEPALRFPSLLAAGSALWVFFRMVKARFDTPTATAAVVLLAFLKTVAFEACNARPYALALLCSIVSVHTLLLWLEGGRRGHALAYALSACLTVYLQPLFATMFGVHAAFAVASGLRPGASMRLALSRFISALIACAVLLLPIQSQIASLAARWQILVGPGNDPWLAFRPFVEFVALFGAGMLVLRCSGRARLGRIRDLHGTWPLAVWALLPPTFVFLLSRTVTQGLFRPRYYVCAMPGLALLLSTCWRLIEPRWIRNGTLMAAAAFWAALGAPVNHMGEDWRGAMASARALWVPGAQLLLRSGLVESQSTEWLRERGASDYLTAPATVYPAGTVPTPLPLAADSAERLRYLEQVTDKARAAPRIIVVEHTNSDLGTHIGALLGPGFRGRAGGIFGLLRVICYERP